jgi:hypothetical protein
MKMERQKTKKSIKSIDLVKSTIGGAVVGGGIYLLFKGLVPKSHAISPAINELNDARPRHHTIPPIIIKSGTSELESEPDLEMTELLKDTESVTAPLARPWRYRASSLDPEPRVVRVVRYNKDTMASPVEYLPQGFEIGSVLNIWLQRYRKSTKTWEWVNETEPQIQISRSTSNSLDLEFEDKLSPRQDNEHSKRIYKFKYTSGGSQSLRLGRLKVSGYSPIDITREGDEYIISFNVH